jgi:hypothetical protein
MPPSTPQSRTTNPANPSLPSTPLDVAKLARAPRGHEDKVLASVFKIVMRTGTPCDPGKRPSQMGWDLSFWTQLARQISKDLKLEIRDSENQDYYNKPISNYCDFLVAKLG